VEDEPIGDPPAGRVIRFECAEKSERTRADRPPIGYVAGFGLAGNDHLTADLEPDVTVRAEVGRFPVIDIPRLWWLPLGSFRKFSRFRPM
jgi:hypothetical protein